MKRFVQNCGTAVYWMDDRLVASLPSCMTPPRSRYAPTDGSRTSHWLLTHDVYRPAVASTQLEIGTNLHAAMRQAMKACAADG